MKLVASKLVGQPRVLIIVDMLDIVSLDFRQTLDNAGFITELILDSQSNLDHIVSKDPDAIFLHICMSTYNKTALIQALQNDVRLNSVPLVAIAAYAEVADKLFSFADVVLVRPINHERLANLFSLLVTIDMPVEKSPWDTLTGFYTPAYFIARLNQAIGRLRQDGSKDFTVFSINLDQLLQYEKKFGKEYRQQILLGTAKVLKNVLRPDDMVSRFDADQFLVLVENSVDRYAPVSIAERMQFEFDEFLLNSGLLNRIRIEIGVLCCDVEYETTEEVIRDAQRAVQKARDGFPNSLIPDRQPPAHTHYFVGNKTLLSA